MHIEESLTWTRLEFYSSRSKTVYSTHDLTRVLLNAWGEPKGMLLFGSGFRQEKVEKNLQTRCTKPVNWCHLQQEGGREEGRLGFVFLSPPPPNLSSRVRKNIYFKYKILFLNILAFLVIFKYFASFDQILNILLLFAQMLNILPFIFGKLHAIFRWKQFLPKYLMCFPL